MPQRGKICVAGGGATAAWCVEVGLKTGNEVLWVARRALDDRTFPESFRNDGLLATQFRRVRPLPRGLYPADERLRWAEGYEVRRSSTANGGKVRIEFSKRAAPRFVGHEGTDLGELESWEADQVIAALGPKRKAAKEGSPAWLLRDFISESLDPALHLIFGQGREPRPVGLRDDTDSIRVLGSAALTHPAWEQYIDLADEYAQRHIRYVGSLCQQARMEASATLAATCIAEANRYFDPEKRPNRNVNALPLDWLDDEVRRTLVARSSSREPLCVAPDGFSVEY